MKEKEIEMDSPVWSENRKSIHKIIKKECKHYGKSYYITEF